MIYIAMIAISNKLFIHQLVHIEQQIIDHLTHERMMTTSPIICRKSTEHAAHLPAWWRKYTPLPHPSA